SACTFTFSCRHARLDGWSIWILCGELGALLTNPGARVPGPPPYQSYIEWFGRQDHERARAYWSAYLEGFPGPIPLPGVRQFAPARDNTASYAESYFALDELESRTVQQFASSRFVTVNTLLQSAFGLLLARYSGEKDITFGVTASGRDIDLPGVEQMIGLFINTTPMRLCADSNVPVHRWIAAVQETHQANARRAYIPLAEIQLSAGMQGSPLFH